MVRGFSCFIIITSIFFFLSDPVCGQKQLVLLKGENVKLRLFPGDEITFSLKGSREKRRSYINNLFDTAVMVHNTVIPFHKIGRIYFKQSNFGNVIGGMLVTGGVGYFVIDQVNIVIVNGEKVDLDERVTLASAILVSAGLPLLLLKKKYRTVGRKYRLRTVDKGSGFYRPDLRQEITD